MNYYKSILICGGDRRQKYMYKKMLDDGYDVSTCCLGEADSVKLDDIGSFDILIFPVPVSTDGITLNAPLVDFTVNIEDILCGIKKGTVVFGGMCEKINYDMIDYYKDESLQMYNAIPTAEGAICTAMENTDFAIYGAKCLVTGYGRIGKVLSKRLCDMGAKVTVSARNPKDLALAEAMGCKAVNLSFLSDVICGNDIIFNTVPKNIITAEILGRVKKEVPIIELASKPYGVDMDAAKAMGRKVIIASGLPGKYAPRSSGLELGEIIIKLLREMEV